MNNNFKSPLLKSEQILGGVYLPVHMFLLPWLLVYVYSTVLRHMDVVLTSPNLNLIYYVISFLFVLVFLFRYLKASFSDFLDNVLGSLKSILLAYVFNYLFITLVSILLVFLLKDVSNPNSQTIVSQTKLDPDVMLFVAVLLVPIVEETLFRGVLFGSIRNKSRVLAYIVTALVFSVYHLWQYLAGGFDWTIFLYFLQYVPASLALSWCYEKSGTIWAPILLHAIINFISLQVIIG